MHKMHGNWNIILEIANNNESDLQKLKDVVFSSAQQ